MTLERRKKKSIKRKKVDYKTNRLKYVIQKHKASSTHWDLRLQQGNRMYSWAIPKGPSLNPSDKRLAILTTPHSRAYSDFEGIIVPGLYGAGKVMQWDNGTYTPITKDIAKGIKDGFVEFELYGDRLQGRWALVKVQQRWLLVKAKDKYAREDIDVVKKYLTSVESGKTFKEIDEQDGLITSRNDLGF